MFVPTHDIDANELRDVVAEANRTDRVRLQRIRPVRLQVVHDVDREREAQAIILRLILAERPAELRIEAVMARIGEPRLAARAITALVDSGLLIRVDEYLLATAAAAHLDRLRPLMSPTAPRSTSAPAA